MHFHHRYAMGGGLLLLLSAALPAQAGIPAPQPLPSLAYQTENDYYLFKSGEVFVDLFGSVTAGGKLQPDSYYGGGIAAGYFANRFLGVMVEGCLLDLPDYTGSVSGGLVVRLPVDDMCTAFYGFAEIGADFADKTRCSRSFGGGLDVRMTDHISVFADARAVFVDNGRVDSSWLVRSGIRFVF